MELSKVTLVSIETRDINGVRKQHILASSCVCNYILEHLTDDDEILLVFEDGNCIYSQLGHNPITRMELLGFFA